DSAFYPKNSTFFNLSLLQAVKPPGIARKDSVFTPRAELLHRLPAVGQPAVVVASEPQHRPIAPPEHPLGSKQNEDLANIRKQYLPVLPGGHFGNEPREFAADIGMTRQRRQPLPPVPPLPFANGRLGGVIEHNGQLWMALGQGFNRWQMARIHQRIKAQLAFTHDCQRLWLSAADNPVVLRQVLQHRPQPLQVAISGQRGNLFNSIS